jgi:hypothetical protein
MGKTDYQCLVLMNREDCIILNEYSGTVNLCVVL